VLTHQGGGEPPDGDPGDDSDGEISGGGSARSEGETRASFTSAQMEEIRKDQSRQQETRMKVYNGVSQVVASAFKPPNALIASAEISVDTLMLEVTDLVESHELLTCNPIIKDALRNLTLEAGTLNDLVVTHAIKCPDLRRDWHKRKKTTGQGNDSVDGIAQWLLDRTCASARRKMELIASARKSPGLKKGETILEYGQRYMKIMQFLKVVKLDGQHTLMNMMIQYAEGLPHKFKKDLSTQIRLAQAAMSRAVFSVAWQHFHPSDSNVNGKEVQEYWEAMRLAAESIEDDRGVYQGETPPERAFKVQEEDNGLYALPPVGPAGPDRPTFSRVQGKTFPRPFPGPRKCYNCGVEGHLARDCQEPRKDGPPQRTWPQRQSGNAHVQTGLAQIPGAGNKASLFVAEGSAAGRQPPETIREPQAGDTPRLTADGEPFRCYKCGRPAHSARGCMWNLASPVLTHALLTRDPATICAALANNAKANLAEIREQGECDHATTPAEDIDLIAAALTEWDRQETEQGIVFSLDSWGQEGEGNTTDDDGWR
jgi:hypothetical protein